MSSTIFKISTVAATIAASFAANAALYNVYLEAPEGASSSLLTYGVAVSEETSSCWTVASCTNSTSKIATEVKRFRDGFSYRDEAAFAMPFGWTYLDDNWEGFRNYCRSYLGYTTTLCENWATAQYTNGYKKEQDGNYSGSIAYFDGSADYSESAVINSIDNGLETGNRRDGASPRNLAYTSLDGSSVTDLPKAYGGTTYAESHAWKTLFDGTDYLTVGSVSSTGTHASSNNNSYAAVWKNGVLQEPIAWINSSANSGDRRAHGSARDIIIDGTDLFAVGYNSGGDVRFKATVFKSTDSGANWISKEVSGFPYDEDQYLNQTLQAVNNNKKAIGSAKLARPLSGAYANTLFYVPDVSAATLAYTEFSGSIFFSGANGTAGNINNHNDVVGTIDFETHSETSGKPRAQRAFITNLGYVAGSSAPIGGQARYLDDLTSGSGASTNNNQYRIIQAADINDAGVIAATAYYCAGGYDSEAIDASCSAGASLVGVKLVPIKDQTAADISPRPVTQVTVEREGGTLGYLALGLLGLLGFRRK